MLLTRMKIVVLGVLMLGIVASVAVSQQDGGRQKSFGFKAPDPEETFKQLSGGKDEIIVSEVVAPDRWRYMGITTDVLRERLSTFLQTKGINNGRVTLQQYKEYSEERAKTQGGGKRPDSGKDQSDKSTDKDKDKDKDKKDKDKGKSPEEIEAEARRFFTYMDKNGDSSLAGDELKGLRMRSEDREKYGITNDSKIDFDKYLTIFKEMREAREARENNKGKDKGGKDKGKGGDSLDEDAPKTIPDVRPTVYRIGSLPKDLPSWYVDNDKDKDGQIGLYEWKAAGKKVEEFVAMDANGDGFVTVEEILRSQRAAAAKKEGEGKLTSLLPMQSIIMPGAGSTPTKGKGDKGGKGDFGKGKGDFGKGKGFGGKKGK